VSVATYRRTRRARDNPDDLRAIPDQAINPFAESGGELVTDQHYRWHCRPKGREDAKA
jgi:hypothetical protein